MCEGKKNVVQLWDLAEDVLYKEVIVKYTEVWL